MLCLFTLVLRPEAERRLARSMNAAPVELERLDKLPNASPSAWTGSVERRILDIDMHRLAPLVTSLIGLTGSFSGKESISILAVVGEACLEEAGDMSALAPAAETGSPYRRLSDHPSRKATQMPVMMIRVRSPSSRTTG